MYRLISLIILLISLVSCSEDSYVKSYHGVEIGYTGYSTVRTVIDNDEPLTFPLILRDKGQSISYGLITKFAIKLPDSSIKKFYIDKGEVSIVCQESNSGKCQITMSKAMFLYSVLKMNIKEELMDEIVIELPKEEMDKAYMIL